MEAKKAISTLNGLSVRGKRLKVSMARYSKGGAAFIDHQSAIEVSRYRPIKNPSFRDHRKYSEVLLHKQNATSKVDGETKAIHICFSLNVPENKVTSSMLEKGCNSRKYRSDQPTTDETETLCHVFFSEGYVLPIPY